MRKNQILVVTSENGAEGYKVVIIYTQLRIISCWTEDKLRLVKWSTDSKRVLKQAYLSLLDAAVARISSHCMHVKGRGGVKGAVRWIYRQLGKYNFVARLDIKSYYNSINHDVLLGILSDFGLEENLFDIVQQYLKIPDRDNTGVGIVAGGALSPFLGAVYLSPLDYAMEKMCKTGKIFYIRYQDDVVIV